MNIQQQRSGITDWKGFPGKYSPCKFHTAILDAQKAWVRDVVTVCRGWKVQRDLRRRPDRRSRNHRRRRLLLLHPVMQGTAGFFSTVNTKEMDWSRLIRQRDEGRRKESIKEALWEVEMLRKRKRQQRKGLTAIKIRLPNNLMVKFSRF